MRNANREFSFRYPLTRKAVRDLQLVVEHLGDFEVLARGFLHPGAASLDVFNRCSVEIDAVRWNGADILPVLEVAGMMTAIREAAVRRFATENETALNQAA